MTVGHLSSWASKIPQSQVRRIADCFEISESFQVYDFVGKGNIHTHTFLVVSHETGQKREYLLQMLNSDVFPNPDSVMDVWITCTQAQQKSLELGMLEEKTSWKIIQLIPTREGQKYLKIEDAGGFQFWRLMVRIPNVRSYKSLGEIHSAEKRIEIAEETGKGLAIFQTLTAGIDPKSICEPLPGYRNTALYYAQLDSVLQNARTLEDASLHMPSDPILRMQTGRHFLVRLNPGKYRQRMAQKQVRLLVALALDNRAYCLGLQKALTDGLLRKTIVHGDTKLDNFLFDLHTDKVKALVDLDTVMAHTWLSDWGDMARSLVNVQGEDRTNDACEIDIEVFKALARGFTGLAPQLSGNEMDLMVDAARIMALELGVRFLADYLRGDTYFTLDADAPEDLNRRRAAVQFSVFQKLGETAAESGQYIKELQEQQKGV